MTYTITSEMVPAGHMVEARNRQGVLRYLFTGIGQVVTDEELVLATVPIPVIVQPTLAQLAAAELPATDAGMARVVEDLITVLVSKGVIEEADLPDSAQAKLAERTALRQQIQRVEQ
jgi:hypothetical protein